MAINQIRRSRKARLGQLALAGALAAILTGSGVAGAQSPPVNAQGDDINETGYYAVGPDYEGAGTGLDAPHVIDGYIKGASVYIGGASTVTNSSFTDYVTTADGDAKGGVFYAGDVSVITNSSFSNNVMTTNATTGFEMAEGGAIYAADDLKTTSTIFSGNQAVVSGASTNPNVEASGGAIFAAAGDLDVTSSTFTGNQAANYGAGNAAGGAIMTGTATDATFSGATTFINNMAFSRVNEATGGAIFAQDDISFSSRAAFNGNAADGDKAAFGGAIATGSGGDLYLANGGTFTNNTATSNVSTGKAYGGALYLAGVNHEIKGSSSFTNNTVTGNTAKGGAIFLDSNYGNNTLTFDLGNNDKVTISDNTANGSSNGIQVGSTNGVSGGNSAINIATGLNAEMKMDDVLRVDMNNGFDFDFTKTGAGALRLNNVDRIGTTGGSKATFDYLEGTTFIGKDYTMIADAGGANIDIKYGSTGKSSTIVLDTRRDKNLALYDASATSNTTFDFGVTNGGPTGGTTIDVADTTLHILDFNDKYLYVENGNGTQVSQLTGFGFSENLAGSTFDLGTDGNVYLNANYNSPYKNAISKAGSNTNSAINNLGDVVYNLADGDQRKAVIDNFDTVTPEAAIAAGPMAMTTTQGLARMALKQSLVQDHHDTLYTPTQAQPGYGGPNEGARVFGGYYGNFRNVDGDKGYFGYDQEAHGAIIGASYDFGYGNSIGIYAGVTDSTLDMDRVKAKTESEGTHVGVVGRFSPEGNFDPNYTFYVDAGYSGYTNDTTRKLGAYKSTGSFNQNAFTFGAAAEYVNHLDDQTRVTPGLELRYTSLYQRGFREKGLTATRVDGHNVDSFTSTLGVGVEHEINLASGGILTPSARIGWQHEYGETEYDTKAKYQNPNGGYIPGKFKLGTVSTDRDSFDGGVGMRAVFNSGSYHEVGLNLNYDVNVSENSNTHSVYGGLDYRF